MFFVLVSGKRDFSDYDYFCESMERVIPSDEDVTIVQGGAAGADALARRYAKDHGYSCQTFPALWDIHGKAAGPIRNSEMVEFVARQEYRVSVFFWDGKSRGTGDCFRKAEKAGIVRRLFDVS